MKERPILFSAEMIRALLAGRKTQTRRLVKDCRFGPKCTLLELLDFLGGGGTCDSSEEDGLIITHVQDYTRKNDGQKPHKYTGLLVQSAACPEEGAEEIPHNYGLPGDHLWVKETFSPWADNFTKRVCNSSDKAVYRADYRAGCPSLEVGGCEHWKPSIFMPRWASRLTLKIKSLRVQRLHDISDQDVMAEGVSMSPPMDADIPPEFESLFKWRYCKLWESLNGAQSWKDNPWVWVIEFICVHPSAVKKP